MNAHEDFRKFCENEGFALTDPVEAGRIIRFHVKGDKRSGKNGYYLFFNDGVANGFVGSWKGDRSDRRRWRADGPVAQVDRDDLNRKREQRRAKIAAEQAAAAARASKAWNEATPINGASHPYLDRKGIMPCGTRQIGDRIIVPVRDAEQNIISVQSIVADGGKRFTPGSKVEGGHFVIGSKDDGPIILCEGFSTGASLYQATGHMIVVAFDASNLVTVSRWANAVWTGRAFIIAGDDDAHLEERGGKNVGREAALNAARNLGALCVFPVLQGAEGSDFNDQATHYGLKDVASLFSEDVIAPASRGPLALEWFDEIDAQLTANWLVDDLIPSNSLCLIYGHPGCGKSFFALDIAMHVAGGNAWRDRSVEQGLVIYIGAEGQRGLRQRVAAFRKHNKVEILPFALIPVEVNLLSADGDLKDLIATIQIACARFGLPVAMIVIDTLARTFGGGDEVGSDMVQYVNNVGHLQAAFSCTTMVVHHRPKDSSNETPRGHGSLWGACDTIILIEDMGGTKQAKVTKQKDAEAGNPVLFSLHVVELGEDDKGRPVTSCVVVPSDSQVFATSANSRLSNGQQIALIQLKIATEESGGYMAHSVPDDRLPRGQLVKVVSLSEWQSRTTSALSDPDKSPDTLRRTFHRYRERLQGLGIIGVYEDWVWLTK